MLAMHTDAVQPGQRVLLVDDLLATGGTLIASVKLVERLGASVAQVQVVIELTDLGGRQNLVEFGVNDLYAMIRTS